MPAEHLRTQDATLWSVQAHDAPLQIGALCLFDAGPLRDASGVLRITDLRRHIDAQLQHAPRFRQRLAPVPFDQGIAWVDDVRFDIAHHVRVAALPPPGDDDALRDHMAHLLEVPLDPTRPLWEMWVVDGVAGDRVALIPKVSHVMADGMALLEFALALLDPAPTARDQRPSTWAASTPPSAGALLAGALLERARRQVVALGQLAATVADPRTLAHGVATAARAAITLSGRAPALPITRAVGPHRAFAWARLSLPDVRRVARTQGTTVNDVALAITTGALAHYLDGRGVPPGGRAPRVLVPVSTHGRPGDEIENRFSMMVAELPVSIPDPVERLGAIHAEMGRHKGSSQTAIGPLLFSLGDLIPQWALRVAGPVALRRQPFVNLAVTNLRGAHEPGFLLGSRLLEVYPFVCGTGNIAVIIGVLSYGDALGVGITVDADVVPDVAVLADGFERAALELVEVVTGRPTRSSRARTRAAS